MFKAIICFFKGHSFEWLPKEEKSRYIRIEQCKRCGEKRYIFDGIEFVIDSFALLLAASCGKGAAEVYLKELREKLTESREELGKNV